jgi:hypothetical protein
VEIKQEKIIKKKASLNNKEIGATRLMNAIKPNQNTAEK